MMSKLTALAICTICGLTLHVLAHADGLPTTASIEVGGENGKSLHFGAAELAKLQQHTISAQAHGQTLTCTGPNLIDLLVAVGAPQGQALRGKALALYVHVSAADGYRAVFSLAELDPEFRGAVPIVTATCNGKPLDSSTGPFRLVVPGDKRPARWVHQVTAVNLVQAP